MHWLTDGHARLNRSPRSGSISILDTRPGETGLKVSAAAESNAVHWRGDGQATATNPALLSTVRRLAPPGAAGSNVASTPSSAPAVHWRTDGHASESSVSPSSDSPHCRHVARIRIGDLATRDRPSRARIEGHRAPALGHQHAPARCRAGEAEARIVHGDDLARRRGVQRRRVERDLPRAAPRHAVDRHTSPCRRAGHGDEVASGPVDHHRRRPQPARPSNTRGGKRRNRHDQQDPDARTRPRRPGYCLNNRVRVRRNAHARNGQRTVARRIRSLHDRAPGNTPRLVAENPHLRVLPAQPPVADASKDQREGEIASVESMLAAVSPPT